MDYPVLPALPRTSISGNPRIKYHPQYKDGNAYFSLNNIHDEATALCHQSQAQNEVLNSQPNWTPASLISEPTQQVTGRTDQCHPGAEEVANPSLGMMAYHNQHTQSWQEQPNIGYSQPFALDTRSAYHQFLNNGIPEAPVRLDQSERRKRGRPPGSKNKPKPDPSAVPPEKRKRGRPLGAKNKPKVIGAPPAEATGVHPTPSLRMPPWDNLEPLSHNGSTLDENGHTYGQSHGHAAMIGNSTRYPYSVQEPSEQWRPTKPTEFVRNSASGVWVPKTDLNVNQDPITADWTLGSPHSSTPPSKPTNSGPEKRDKASARLDIDADFDATDGIMPENMTAAPDLEVTKTPSGSTDPSNGDLSTTHGHGIGPPVLGLPESNPTNSYDKDLQAPSPPSSPDTDDDPDDVDRIMSEIETGLQDMDPDDVDRIMSEIETGFQDMESLIS